MRPTKRESLPYHCTPISSSIRVCWVDLLVISLIALVVASFLFCDRLAACLCKFIRGSSNPFSGSTTSFPHPPSRLCDRMSLRRQHSQEMVSNGLGNGGNERFYEDIFHDPFLIVQPSFNDSMLVKQGLVEETTLPLPIHNAYDVQGRLSQAGNVLESSSTTRSRSCADATPVSLRLKGGAISRDALISSPKHGSLTNETESSGGGIPLPPPPAYTPYFPGQGRRAILCDVA
ncbi:hypothetical protein BC827DRAFT_34961 [Russula dissimulans]|nr:hypothetical protein BC827DRAFT_34961 [Russula dissimulans]